MSINPQNLRSCFEIPLRHHQNAKHYLFEILELT